MCLFLFADRFLVLQPEASKVITDTKKHGDTIVKNFDSILQLLGPDIEFLADICQQVGRRHYKLGVKPSYFLYMGQSLLFALQQALGEKLLPEDREAWREVYAVISDEIVRNMKD